MDGYEANLLGTVGSVVFGFTGLDFYKDLSDIAYGLENWENTPGDYLNLGINVIALAPVLGAFKNLGKPALDAASNVAKQIDDEVAALRAIGANNRSAPDFHNNISQKQPGGYLRAPGRPVAGGGADLARALENMTPEEVRRIQNAANRIGEPIHVVGSRSGGPKLPRTDSDWDFVIEANNKTRRSAARSLPGAKSVQQGTDWNQDVFIGPLKPDLPHITFYPE